MLPEAPDLSKIKDLLPRVSQGPWEAVNLSESGHRASSWSRVYMGEQYWSFDIDTPRHTSNAALIAELVTKAPAILKYIEALEARVRELQGATRE